MNKREKILAAALLAILVLLGGNAWLKRHRAAVALTESQLQAAKGKLAEARMTLNGGQKAMQRLDKWQALSLPTNRDVARSLLHGWLLQKAKEAGLTVEDINPNDQTTPSTTFQSIGYVIEAKGTLSSLTKFLYEFYHTARLQQITKLQLTSTPGSPELRIQLRVEALILPGATHDDSLPDGKSERLKLASAAEYEKSIVGRDMFKAYTPPRPPREIVRTTPRPPAPKFDEASQAYVTGIVRSGERLQAWITVRTTGEVLRLHEGDDVKIGELEGKIESIQPRLIVVTIDDEEEEKPLRIQLGHSLRDEEKPDTGGDADAKPAEDEKKT